MRAVTAHRQRVDLMQCERMKAAGSQTHRRKRKYAYEQSVETLDIQSLAKYKRKKYEYRAIRFVNNR